MKLDNLTLEDKCEIVRRFTDLAMGIIDIIERQQYEEMIEAIDAAQGELVDLKQKWLIAIDMLKRGGAEDD